MTTYTKPPISISEQLSILKQRGLSFENDKKALEQLGNISYFRLANYWKPLEQDKISHIFKPGSTFDRVLLLYNFDKELRDLLFSAIQVIEIGLRTRVIQKVSSRYGAFWFAEASRFSDESRFGSCLKKLLEEISRSKEPFLLEHARKYDTPPYPPAWKALEVSSFGTLSKLYCNLADTKLKKQIAKDLSLPHHCFLESWAMSLSVLRNCVAHHARVWNRKFPLKPQLPRYLVDKWINLPAQQAELLKMQTKLYAQLCCMAYLLNVILPTNKFAQTLKALLSRYPNVDVSAMGFPEDWKSQPLWR